MFGCLAIVASSKQWAVKILPVLESRIYKRHEWERILSPLLQESERLYISQAAKPIRDIGCFLASISNNITFENMLRIASKKLQVKWLCLNNVINNYQFGKEAHEQELLNLIATKVAGRLLHLYELQKSMQRQHVHMSLEKLMVTLAQWSLLGKIELLTGFSIGRQGSWNGFLKVRPIIYQCRRCSNYHVEREQYSCYSCNNNCIYCPQCMVLGKVKSCSILIRFVSKQHTNIEQIKHVYIPSLIEKYNLSSAQSDAVLVLLHAIKEHYGQFSNNNKKVKELFSKPKKQLDYILWAVTGAGKTEMIFPLIHLFLHLNLKVLIAIPRRDVVQELLPRVKKAFPLSKVVGLYGGSEEVWEHGDIYITTTHQLIRFDSYFDLIILDEMDAFPYYNNKTLMRTLKRIQNTVSCCIQLTATIPRKEKIKINLRRQKYVQVPVRFHQKPLPIPKYIAMKPLANILKEKRIPDSLIDIVNHSYARGAVLFIFLQRKKYLAPFTRLIQQAVPNITIEYTSAEDDKRETKVSNFRQRKIDVLVTTSILERGVTIKKSDICIVDSHQKAFNRTAIVQMAGRAGRSVEDPCGYVFLCGDYKTKEMKQAIKEIEAMNKLAKKKGYLAEG